LSCARPLASKPMDHPQKSFMRLAIDKAMEGVDHGQTPFGACIVKGEKVVALEHNVVGETTDITAHAEIHAIREACHTLNTIDLSGCEIYSTCEPCPMCFTACHWARLDRIISGTDISDAKAFGFNELTVSNEVLREKGGSDIEIVSGFLRDECLVVFERFSQRQNRLLY